MSRMINRLYGRVYGWFDSKEARRLSTHLPAKFSTRAQLALQNLEDRTVPAAFLVENTNDSGAGSLRQAILDANTSPGDDTITFNTVASPGKVDFDAGLNTIFLSSAITASNSAGEGFMLTGPGADKLVITRGTASAMRFLDLGTGNNDFTISDMTIRSISSNVIGGVISFRSTATTASFTMERTNITGTTVASGFSGGVLYLRDGTHSITDSTISGTSISSSVGGAAIRINATAANTNTINITNSTITGNTNASTGPGGAILLSIFTGTLNIANSTIVNNSTATTSTVAGNGGGITRTATTALTVNLTNSIVAANSTAQASNKRLDIAFGASGSTLIATNSVIGSTTNISGTVNIDGTNKTGTDLSPLAPNLSVLGYHTSGGISGPTPVRIPLSGSPALNNGNSTGKDQVGVTRANPSDIGSVEAPAGPFAMAGSFADVTTSGGTSYPFALTFYDAAGTGIDATTLDDGDEVQILGSNGFSAFATFVDFTPGTGVANYKFTPPGGSWDANDNDVYTINIVGGQIFNLAGSPVAIDAGLEGGFGVLLPAPTAALTGDNGLYIGGGTTHTFTVTYTDVGGGAGLDASTFGNDDVRVTGPNSFNQVATKVSVDQPGNGTPRTVTYQITAPGGTWDVADEGIYTVSVESQKVANTVGTYVTDGSVGSFGFALPTTFTVTNSADAGPGSLRDQIIAANTNVPGSKDIIVFDATVFNVPTPIILTNNVGSGQLVITDSVNIIGPDPATKLVTLDANFATRHFKIDGSGSISVSISNIAMISGAGSDGAPSPVAGDGGSITIGNEIVVLDHVTMTGNQTSSSNDGGAVNVAAGGNLTIRNSTLSGNSTPGAAGADGGAIYFGNGGNLTIENSTLSGNSSKGRGGAIYFDAGTTNPGTLIVSNSTLSANSTTSAAGTGGGAIWVQGTSGSISVRNSTIIDNFSDATATTTGGGGGGIANLSTGITFDVISSVVTNNISSNGRPDISAATAAGVNISNSALGSDAGFTYGTNSNNLTVGIDFKLGVLQDNGAGIFTHLPANDSPLLDRGSNTFSLTTDQRGFGTDVVNYPRSKGKTDIGAVEAGIAQIPIATATLKDIGASEDGQAFYSFTVTYSDSVSKIVIESLNDGDEVRVTGPNAFDALAAFVSVDNGSDGTPRTATYKVSAPINNKAGFDISDNGTYSVTMEANQVQNQNGSFVEPGLLGTFDVSIPGTYTVTNTNDNGAGSLRQAILDANASMNTLDTILFDTAGVFATPQTITLAEELPISDPVNLDGSTGDGGRVTLSGGNSKRIFNINGTGNIVVNINDFNLTDASASTRGGAISSQDEILSLTDVTITSSTSSSNGGAIGTIGGPGTVLNLTRVVISNNKGTIGGAIDTGGSASSLNITDSTISDNTASSTNGGAVSAAHITLVMTGSTISGNSAASAGGAFQFPNSANVTISNSTISGNTSNGIGGAAINFATTATYLVTANIRNSTITLNNSKTTSTSSSGGINWNNTKAGSTLTLNSVILAGNLIASSSTTASPDIRFSAAGNVAGDNNLIGVGLTSETNVTFTGTNPLGTSSDKANPLLAKLLPLAGNGGPTATHAFGSDSPANNAGNNIAPTLSNDQRGSGFARLAGLGVDIGSYERDPSIPTASVGTLIDINDVNAAANDPYTFTVTYVVETDQILGTSLDDGDEIRITGPNGFNTLATFVSANPTGDAASIIATYKFIAPSPAAGWDGADNGIYTVSVEGGQVSTVLTSKTVPAATLGTFLVAIPATFTVTNTDDSGAGSLRQAVLDANASPTADFIVFSSLFDTPQTIQLTSGEIAITDAVTIDGKGALLTTVDASDNGRHFNTTTAPLGAVIEIKDLTLTNASSTANGGSIFVGDEAVTIRDTHITDNTTNGNGGAIFTDLNTSITIINSTLSGNVGKSANFGGGALYLTGGAGSTGLNIQNSTLSGNKSSGSNGGGAIYAWTTIFPISITNSTFSGNSSAASGGAIRINQATSTINLFNTTIVDNTAGTTGGGLSSTGTIVLDSTLVSRNSAAGSANDFLAGVGQTFQADFSAWTVNPAATVTGSDNKVDTPGNLGFAFLSNNGGLNQTVRVFAGGLLTDNGRNTLALANDGRGAGFPRDIPSGKPDIGAFELDPAAPTAAVSSLTPVNAGNAATLNPYNFDITFTGTGIINGSTLDDGDEVRIIGPNGFNTLATFVSAAPSGNAASIVATYKFIAPALPTAGWDGGDNGTYTVSLEAGQVFDLNSKAVPGGALGTITVAIPATYVVLNTNDDGIGSLRQAILDANASSDLTDTIMFEATTFSTPQTISLLTELTITDGVIIEGPGKSLLTVTNTSGRIMTVTIAGSNALTVQDMRLTGSSVTGNGGAANITGGDTVTFLRTNISNNTATALGGAIATTAGTNLTIENSILDGNMVTATTGDGGAIHSATSTLSSITIRNTAITGNTAGDNGGAISMLSGSLLIENSTLSGNSAGTGTTTGDGGGLYFNGTVGAGGLFVRNSTISGNHATTTGSTTQVSGGGLAFLALNGTANIQNSTIVNNTSVSTSTTAGFGGGGIAQTGASGNINITSSIVSGNVSANARTDISAINPVTLVRSAVGDAAGFTLAGASTGNLAFGTDLKLGALADNLGPTFTHLPANDSPLIDRGSNPAGLKTDQRGAGTDTINYPRSKGITDIGAVEVLASVNPLASVDAQDESSANAKYFFTVTYEASSAINGSTIDDNDFRITGPGGFDQQAFYDSGDKTNGSPRVITYYINVPGGGFTFSQNGVYSVVMQASQVSNTPEGNFITSGTLDTFNVALPAIFTVTNTNDSGAGSLRQAVLDANATVTPDLVVFDSSFDTPQTINLTSGTITIEEAVTIQGKGANLTTVTGGSSRHFTIASIDTNATISVTISGLTLTGSTITGAGGSIDVNNENVTLTNMYIHSNSASTTGGAINAAAAGAVLNLNRTTIANNNSTGVGGAIRLNGLTFPATLNMESSTITGNTAGSIGGALYGNNFTAGSVVNINNSTITANSGTTSGGIRATANTAVANIFNSIISGNSGSSGPDILSFTANTSYSAIGSSLGYTKGTSSNDLAYGAVLNLQPLALNGGPTPTMALGAGSAALTTGSPTNGQTTDQRGAGFARIAGTPDIGAFEDQTALPVVTGFVVNDGDAQRSRLTKIVVNFQSAVDVNQFHAAGAVFLTRTAIPTNNIGTVGTVVDNTSGLVITPANGSGNTTSITLTFQNIDNDGVDFSSIADGRWQLSVVPAGYTSPNNPGDTQLRRLFGNIDNDTTVGGTDFGFYPNFGATSGDPTAMAFDFNNDGSVLADDFGEFGNRFGFTLV